MAAITPSTGTAPFQRSVQLQTPRSTATALSSAITSLDGNERGYWEGKFGLLLAGGASSSSSCLSATIAAGSSSVVHQVLCDPHPGSTAAAIAVLCGPRVQLYGTSPLSPLTRALKARKDSSSASPSSRDDVPKASVVGVADRQIPTAGQLARCGSFRSDGRLVAIGTDRGIRVSQVSTRAALATYPTPFGVRAVAWFRDGQTIMATCDDAIRLFRLSGKSGDGTGPVRTVRGRHGDVIRCGALWQGGPNGEALGFTGSYDHTVRMWDLTPRAGIDDEDDDEYDDDTEGRCCLSVMVHGAPVEALVLLENTAPSADPPPGGGGSARRPWLVTAGGTHLKVWDLRTGACAGTYPTRHNKTVAALIGSVPRVALEDDGRTVRQARPRLVSGGLDGYLGFHAWDGSTGTIVPDLYGTRLRNDEGITALGGTAFRIAIGTVRGRVHVRDRAVGTSSSSRKRAAAQPRAGTYSFFARGMNATAGAGDYVVGADTGVDKKRKLHAYDVALKQFRYGDALDEALGTRAPKIVAAVLEELGRRRGLRIALSSRDEETLEPILAFTVRYIGQPRFAALLIGVSHMLIDIYSDVAGQSETIDELFAKLRTQVSTEARIQRKLLGVVGQLDGLIASVAHLDDDDESQ